MCKPAGTTRELYGMTYKSIEISHPVTTPITGVLRDIAVWLEENGESHVLPTSLTTQSDPDDDETFLTTFVWAV